MLKFYIILIKYIKIKFLVFLTSLINELMDILPLLNIGAKYLQICQRNHTLY